MWRLLLGTMGVKSHVQGLNAPAMSGFEPRTVWSKSDAVTDWPPLLLQVWYLYKNILKVYETVTWKNSSPPFIIRTENKKDLLYVLKDLVKNLNRLKASASDLLRNKPSKKTPSACGLGFYARFISAINLGLGFYLLINQGGHSIALVSMVTTIWEKSTCTLPNSSLLCCYRAGQRLMWCLQELSTVSANKKCAQLEYLRDR